MEYPTGSRRQLDRFLRSVARRIHLYRSVLALTRALLAATPPALLLSALAVRWAPDTLPFALALPYGTAAAIAAAISLRHPPTLARTALFAEERIGTGWAIPAAAEQIDAEEISPMALALLDQVARRLDPPPAALCRFPFPRTLPLLLGVPLLIIGAIWISIPDPPTAGEPKNQILARKTLRTLQSLDREEPVPQPDAVSEELGALVRKLSLGGQPEELARKADGIARKLAEREKEANRAVEAAQQVLRQDPDLKPAAQDPSSPDGASLDRFAARLDQNQLDPEKLSDLIRSVRRAREASGEHRDLDRSLRDLEAGLQARNGPGARKALDRLLRNLSTLRRVQRRIELARARARGVAIELGGPGGKGAVPALEESSARAAHRPAQPASPPVLSAELPVFEKAYLEAMEKPRWKPRFDRAVQRYFDTIRSGE